jgi:BirA family transcriptional regulator, biotin operon repressor / biotin---[acetyl-CoA-carboxylase] ligase
VKRTVVEFDVIDSTNSHLKRYHEGYPNHTFIRAGYQQKGRGQFERKWISERAQNLLFSLLLKHVELKKIEQIRKEIIAILLSFFREHGIDVRFKEPNDFLVKDEKIAGILIETKSSGDFCEIVIIGVGINVNQKRFGSIKATSMALESDRNYDLDPLFEMLSIKMHERLSAIAK